MAIDRYYSVRRMTIMRSDKQQCASALVVSVGIWILSFLLSLPLLIYYDVDVLYVFKASANLFSPSTANATCVEDVTIRSERAFGVETKSYGWRQCKMTSTGGADALKEEDIQLLCRARAD